MTRTTVQSTAGGHLIRANVDRGLGVRTREILRERLFSSFRRPDPNDRMQIQQGTRGGKPKVAR